MAASLKKQFPGEEEAIDEFMRLMKVKEVTDTEENERNYLTGRGLLQKYCNIYITDYLFKK